MSLWKYSFDLVTKELEIAKKKKQALDNLYASNKISQSTYDYLDSELSKAITELEDHLNALKEKMTARAQELEKQISTLELFLASLEIHHAAGDVDDETYEKQSNAILLGLEATKQELSDIVASSSKPSQPPAAPPVPPAEPIEKQVEEQKGEELAEAEKEEEQSAEEPPTYQPVTPMETSQEAATETVEEKPSSLAPYTGEPSEQHYSESETGVGY